MKRFLESSSSEEDGDEQGMGEDECGGPTLEEEVDLSQKLFKKVEVDLDKYVYEPVHFVRAHCKPEEKPSADIQVIYLYSAVVLTPPWLNEVLLDKTGWEWLLMEGVGRGIRGEREGATGNLWRTFPLRVLHQDQPAVDAVVKFEKKIYSDARILQILSSQAWNDVLQPHLDGCGGTELLGSLF